MLKKKYQKLKENITICMHTSGYRGITGGQRSVSNAEPLKIKSLNGLTKAEDINTPEKTGKDYAQNAI